MPNEFSGTEVAIIGMAGHYPRSKNLEEFWRHLRDGDELISFFSDEELAAQGVDPALLRDPNFVKAASVLEDMELFDAGFFGVLPREAELMDPQQRIFLEVAWEALEHAGYAPAQYEGLIGVYAGAVENTYLLFNLISHPDITSMGLLPVMVVNGRDYMPTRVSYKLNLRGPSCLVQSACSTSLVAIHTACQSLLNGECDIALAGGVSVLAIQRTGYTYTEGGILSPDGRCRAFDINAHGTIFGSGIGIVVLKPLENALADGDTIHAVIRGSAVNNDGALKVSYTAPSVNGQAEVIIEALANAGLNADTISYVEAHGTATTMGDTIEIQALTQAFRSTTDKKGFCAIGSVKTNLGHLDAAAGVTSVIKTVLALQQKLIPPNLHFTQPNPKIDFANSPFFVNSALSPWRAGSTPRRAGVNSFGIGGTNAHLVLEEAPALQPSGPTRPVQVLVLSAKTDTALEAMTANIVAHLKSLGIDLPAPFTAQSSLRDSSPGAHNTSAALADLADVAYTLQVGRTLFSHRRMLVCSSLDDAITALETTDPKRVLTSFQEQQDRRVAFLFPGQGAQYVNMGRGLYETERLFRETVDICAAAMRRYVDFDLLEVLYPPRGEEEAAAERLNQTALTQPALFVVEYALARLWQSWGVQPWAMLGHSVGEYVAACLAGVFTLEDALALIAQRGLLVQQLPGGSMLSDQLGAAELVPFVQDGVWLAAVNGAQLCTVSGTDMAIEALQAQLAAHGIQSRRLYTSHAFHSGMIDPIVEQFAALVRRISLHPPKLPFISNVTGTWITAEQATDPAYWADHLRQPVQFAAGMQTLRTEIDSVMLEVGPGRTLSSFARQQSTPADQDAAPAVFSSLRHSNDSESDSVFVLTCLGRLWLSGVSIDWSEFYQGEQRRRVPLPTYPFERERYWIDPKAQPSVAQPAPTLDKKANVADWLYAPYWKPSVLPVFEPAPAIWLVFGTGTTLGSELTKRLREAGHTVVAMDARTEGRHAASADHAIDPQQPGDYAELLASLDHRPQRIVYCVDQAFDFYGLIYLAQALYKHKIADLHLDIITQHAQAVIGNELVDPAQALVLGLALVIPQEHPELTCRTIDLGLPSHSWQAAHMYSALLAELQAEPSEPVLAYRHGKRWIQAFEPLQVPISGDRHTSAVPERLRESGVYMITGGLGRIGRTLARYLAESVRARLVLTGRSGLPPRSEWPDWLTTHKTDPTSDNIRFIQELEAQGAEVLVVAADVADREQMHGVIAHIMQRFGALHGVIHAAGIVDEQRAVVLIQDLTRAECEAQLRAKVQGTQVLAEAVQDLSLDFCLLCSSISVLLGGLGFGAYAAANRFMDAFAHRQQQSQPTPWVSVDWDSWLFAGEERKAGIGASVAGQAMSPSEGVQAFSQVLQLGPMVQVVVSTGDIQARVDHWVRRRAAPGTAEPASNLTSRHARPHLQNLYVAPRNDIEETLAAIWRQMLGIAEVGVHDHFFDLGGHSLLATQLISQVRDSFRIELPIRRFFEAPTIAELALVIVQEQMGPAVDEQQLIALLAEVENISNDDFEHLPAEDALEL